MRGVGGPLLCIGDLLSDVGEGGDYQENPSLRSSSSAAADPVVTQIPIQPIGPSDLNQLFQDNYKELNEALSGTDHSWTALTLKLCTALETADKLVQSADTNVKLLSKKVGTLESIMRRGDSAIKAAKIANSSQKKQELK